MDRAGTVPEPPEWIVERISTDGRALVALSGGVDSAVVALLAHRALGKEAHAVTITGSAVSGSEVASAQEVARRIGLPHRVLLADPLTSEEYAQNRPDRCYFCRRVEGSELARAATEVGARQLLDGTHAGDIGGDRPGIRAMEEAGFRHPLLEAGWDKARVRAFAREEGLPNWDRPSNACLASRIAHGDRVTPLLLGQIEEAEARLRALGFRQVRVRVQSSRARIEVGAEELSRLEDPELAERLRREVLSAGFLSVTLDPRGYRPGGGA